MPGFTFISVFDRFYLCQTSLQSIILFILDSVRFPLNVGSTTGSFLKLQPGITESRTISLRSARIIRSKAADRNPANFHLSVADSMILFNESQVNIASKSRRPTLTSIVELNAMATDSWEAYKGLFRSKKFTMMFLCDTIGFFSYMIIFQV